MTQDKRKEDLNKLLKFLETQILRDPKNNWFAKDLYKILAPISDARISDIHELCVEQILAQQAEDFYKDFCITEIKTQLISDFIKMSHWQRRNNFQEFCLALYQQIEAIVNYVSRQESNKLIWRSIRDAKFFVDLSARDIRVRGVKGKSIKQSVIYKSENYERELCDLPAMDKFKAILFLIVYGTNVSWNNKEEYNTDFYVGNDIYHMRNMNHRGSDNSEYQSERTTTAQSNPTLSMIAFLGFFAKFISGINKGITLNKEIIEFAEICCTKQSTIVK